ncbi:MAG: homoserine dehydrogenase [Candidatus Omnitrophica bacterium]|nr:homoserine dehydrogenase [Candidatus Omnitrophota bacterium]
MEVYNIGIVGVGTVGSGVYKQLKRKASILKKKTGISIHIKAVCDKDTKAVRKAGVLKRECVPSYRDMIKDPEINCIVELIGGTSIAKNIILEAFKKGKDVVTANKALLAEEGSDVFKAARKLNRQIFFEASVGGGIPIIKGLTESLVSNRIIRILSIINGTCNYILTRMTHDGMSFEKALAIAKAKGYAEANPSLDIDGIDAAHKITILAELAFRKKINFKEVSCEGISGIKEWDISFADQLGYVVKLLAIAKEGSEGIEVRVQPTLLPKDHILANVNDSYNAVYLMCDEVENMLFYGRGAGAKPTASAVISDIIDLARNSLGFRQKLYLPSLKAAHTKSISSILSRHYLRFSVIDRPGVLAKISSILGRYSISISDVIQKERKIGQVVPLVLLTHETYEKHIQQAVRQIDKLSVIKRHSRVIRIEE